MPTHSLDLEASSSQYASITDASQTGLDITGDMTLEAWVKLESGGFNRVIAGKWNSDTNNRSYLLTVNTSNALEFKVSNDGLEPSAPTASTQALTVGVFQHISVSYTAGTATYYINGKAAGTTSTDSSIFNSNASFVVGVFEATGTLSFDGLIKDVRVFNDVRTQAEIVADAHTENVTDANLQGEWNFNNAYTDSSGNSNDLTATNSPVFVTTIPWTAPADGANTQFIGNAVSWWTMDEASGTRADSITASGNDLTDNNTVGSAAGLWSNAADFENADADYLNISNASQTGLDATGAYSVAFYWKPESITNNHGFFTTVNESNSNYGRRFHWQTTNEFSLQHRMSGGTGTVTWSFTPTAGTGYLVALSFNETNDTAELFVDGISYGAQSIRSNDTTGGDGFRMSGATTVTGSWNIDGLIDEYYYQSTPLDYGNVLDLYAGGDGIPYSGSTNITVTPAAQAATFSLPSETVKTGATISPSVQSITATIPAYTVSLPKTVAVNTQSATFSIPEYVVLAGGILVQPSAQVITASIPAYSVNTDMVVFASVVASTFSIPTYTVSLPKVVEPNAQVATFTIPTYSVLHNALVAASVQALTFSIPTYTVTGQTKVVADAQTLTFSLPAHTVVLGSTITPDAQVLTFILPTLAKVGAVWTKIGRSTDATWARKSRNNT